ncbi:MAG: zf-HC2 domain-containing protein [Desulfomonile tiedjei]|nr:zf-HC2 domain-containing protein [Desulfomonile tiedjei]
MSNSNTKTSSEHCDELLLPYVEDLLAPEQRRIVQEHVDHCSRCSKEVEGLRAIIASLRDNKQAFCPEAWDIYEAVRSGAAAQASLSVHLKQCPRCFEEFQSYTATAEAMPPQLLAKVKERLERSPVSEKAEAPEKKPFKLWEWITEHFRRPAFGVAAAVAAILIVVLIYPREQMEYMVGLSSVAWENVPRPKTGVESTGQRSAVLMFFRNFKEPLSRDKVDTLYQALEPSIEVNERFDVIPPATLTKAIKRGKVDPFNREKLLENLNDEFDVTTAVLVTVEPAARGFDVTCNLARAPEGTMLKDKIVRGVSEAQLAPTVRDAVWELLLGPEAK